MARKGENIYRRKDGRYEGRYIKGYKDGSRPIFGYIYSRTYKECKAKLETAKFLQKKELEEMQELNEEDDLLWAGLQQNRREIPLKVCGAGTVSDFLLYWQQEFIRPHVKPSTFGNYATIVRNRILPLLGDRLLWELDREDIQLFVNTLAVQGISAGTVRNIYLVLHGALRKAEEYGYLSINPCRTIRLPTEELKESRTLSRQEQKQLCEASVGEPYGSAVLLSMYTGLRIGEICGMKWEDVDLDGGILRISRTVQRIRTFSDEECSRTKLYVGTAKSKRSIRVIPLPECAIKLLAQLKEEECGEYVFTCRNHLLEPRVLQLQFKKIIQKAGLEDVHFHSLRHTFATRCMELSMDIRTLSEILGHASAKMTLDRYGHSRIEHKRKAMQSLDDIFADMA